MNLESFAPSMLVRCLGLRILRKIDRAHFVDSCMCLPLQSKKMRRKKISQTMKKVNRKQSLLKKQRRQSRVQ